MRIDTQHNNNINEHNYYINFSAHDNVSQNALFLSILDRWDGTEQSNAVKWEVHGTAIWGIADRYSQLTCHIFVSCHPMIPRWPIPDPERWRLAGSWHLLGLSWGPTWARYNSGREIQHNRDFNGNHVWGLVVTDQIIAECPMPWILGRTEPGWYSSPMFLKIRIWRVWKTNTLY